MIFIQERALRNIAWKIEAICPGFNVLMVVVKMHSHMRKAIIHQDMATEFNSCSVSEQELKPVSRRCHTWFESIGGALVGDHHLTLD